MSVFHSFGHQKHRVFTLCLATKHAFPEQGCKILNSIDLQKKLYKYIQSHPLCFAACNRIFFYVANCRAAGRYLLNALKSTGLCIIEDRLPIPGSSVHIYTFSNTWKPSVCQVVMQNFIYLELGKKKSHHQLFLNVVYILTFQALYQRSSLCCISCIWHRQSISALFQWSISLLLSQLSNSAHSWSSVSLSQIVFNSDNRVLIFCICICKLSQEE